MSNKVTVDGASYCGKVTINGTVLADKIMACHFTDCRKFSGTLFRAVAVISAEQVAIFGAVKEYLKIANSGNDQLTPAMHIFGKSVASWLSTIEDQQWVTERPASAEMTPRGLAAQRL
jgi:cytidylate kinase